MEYTETIQEKNITYFSLIKVFLRLYGCYLIFYGWIQSIIMVNYIMKIIDEKASGTTNELFFITSPGKDALTGVADLVLGILLIFFAKRVAHLIVKDQYREINMKDTELSHIIFIIIKTFAVSLILTSLSAIIFNLVFIAFEIYMFGINDINLKSLYSIPVSVLIIIFIGVISLFIKRLVKLLIK